MLIGKTLLGGVAAFAALAAFAVADPVKNGGFETGNFKQWEFMDIDSSTKAADATGAWQVYKGKLGFDSSSRRQGDLPTPTLSPAPEGEFAAGLFTLGAGTHFLHRLVTVDKRSELSLQLAYKNSASKFAIGDEFDPDGEPNQQVRVDLMKKDASLYSLQDSDIIETLLATKPGDKRKRAYSPLETTVKPGTFRLRIAEVDNQDSMLVGVDDLRLKAK
jgi:adhesin HecA-like repeat protein